MVLKRKKYSLFLIYLYISSCIYSSGLGNNIQDGYWMGIFKEYIYNHPYTRSILSRYSMLSIDNELNTLNMNPFYYFDLNNSNSILSANNNIYIRGLNLNNRMAFIDTPKISFNYKQKLSYNGDINISINYGIKTLLGNNVFMHDPSFSINYRQPIGSDMFNLKKDPYRIMLSLRKENITINCARDLFDQIYNYVVILKNYDVKNNYLKKYELLIKKNNTILDNQNRKKEQNRESQLALFYTEQQISVYNNEYNKLSYEITKIYNESINSVNIQTVKLDNRSKSMLLDFINSNIIEDPSIEYDNRLIDNLVAQNVINREMSKSTYRPSLYFNLSVASDNNNYYAFSDIYNSFYELSVYPYPFIVSMNTGLIIPIGNSRYNSFLTNKYDQEMDRLLDQKKYSASKNINLINETNSNIKNLEYTYKKTLDMIEQEETYRLYRKELLETGLITEIEYYDSEILAADMNIMCSDIFWEIVLNKMTLLKYSKSFYPLISLIGGF